MQHASSEQAPFSRASTGVDLQRWLEILAVLIIAVSVLGLTAARLGVFDALPIWLVSLLLTYGYHRVTLSSPRQPNVLVPVWHVIIVLGAGLLFRLAPYVWILGGQDQGVYVNMAMELARTGGLEPVDHVLAQIVDPVMQEVYRQSNYGSAYLPGVYSTSDGLVFQFYHLFPVWLAMFGDGLGASAAVYGLTFLSLLSLLLFYRVAHLVTGNAKAGLVAGLLLAVNPLHAFFSKFPVTEVPTLAFSLMSFVFLLAYWRAPVGQGDKRLLVISAGAMGLLFMTRISGFMYIPMLYVLSLAVVVFEHDPQRRRDLLGWYAAVVGIYAFSVWYGLVWSAPYSNDIYRLSFQPLLGDHWKSLLGLGLLALSVGWLAVLLAARNATLAARMRWALSSGAKLLPMVALACLAIALYKAYLYGYTDAYAADPWYGQQWDLANKGLRSVFSTSLIASAGYLSPFILLAFFATMFSAARGPVLKVLLLFVVCFLGYVSVLQWALPYQPYYARYLLSEFVPYLILFVVCAWAMGVPGTRRRVLGVALVLGGAWCFALTAMQMGKQEHGGVVESVDRLVGGFEQGDAILVKSPLGGTLGTRLATTLTYIYGLDVVRISDAALRDEDYLSVLSASYDDLFLLLDRNEGVADFVKVGSTRFVEDRYLHRALPPTELERARNLKVYTYRYEPCRALFYNSVGKKGVEFEAGWSMQEKWGIWTAGKSARMRWEIDECADTRHASIVIEGRVYVTSKWPTQRVRVLINGNLVEDRMISYPDRRFELTVPLTSIIDQRILAIEIQTPDAVSPKELGHSGDARRLAFGLESIRVAEPSPEP